MLVKNKEKNIIIEGAISLTIATVIVKILGAIYKIPISYVLGEEGMGYFNSAYTVYSLFYLLCTAGVPKSMMILCGEFEVEDKKIKSIISTALIFFSIIGLAISILFAILAYPLSNFIGSPNAYFAMLFISPSIFFSAISGVIRGYFSAKTKFVHIAISQIIEGAGKLVFGLILAILASRLTISLNMISAFAILGATLGCLLSFIYLLVNIKFDKYNYKCRQKIKIDEVMHIIKRIINISSPIAIGALILSITNIIDLGMVMVRLRSLGYTEPISTALYGNYTTFATPIFNTLVSLFSPLTIAFMPALIKERFNKKGFMEILCNEINISYFIFVPFSIGVCVYSEEILMILFADNGVFLGSKLLVYLIMSIFFLIPLSILNNAMEAVGEEKITMISMIVGGFFKIAVGYFLIGNQNFGILGAPISTLVFYITAFLTSAIIAHKKKDIDIPFITYLALPLINSFISIYAIYAVYLYASTKLNWIISFIFAVIMTIIVYFFLSLLEGILKEKIQIKNRIS